MTVAVKAKKKQQVLDLLGEGDAKEGDETWRGTLTEKLRSSKMECKSLGASAQSE